MTLRVFIVLALAFSLCSCAGAMKKREAKEKKTEQRAKADASNDVSFQAFVGRLRKAVAARDMQSIASMMTTNFGYRLDPPGEGEGVFQHWDQNGLWSELELVLREKFAPKDGFMVAPPQFAKDENYHGYRAGIANVNGSWKFAYFVTD